MYTNNGMLSILLLITIIIYLWWLGELCLHYFPHSLNDNIIGVEGAVAIAEAMKTMTSTNLQLLKYVDLMTPRAHKAYTVAYPWQAMRIQ